MAIRDRLAKADQSPQPASKPVAIAVPDVQCVHRSWSPVGKIKCGCSSSPAVFTCANPWVQSGYCVPRDPAPGTFPPDGPIILTEGGSVLPSDNRVKAFATWPLRHGESPLSWQVPVCSTCPNRIDPPPHIAVLRQLGINGNYDPDTGHCDIVNMSTDAQQWVQHSVDWHDSTPAGIRNCFGNYKQLPSLKDVIEATACRLVVVHTIVANPQDIEAAAKAFPLVRFWAVYHGSQVSMAVNPTWMKNQREFLELSSKMENVWYGTPEPTAPFAALGYKRFLTWPNTFPFDMAPNPMQIHEPASLAICGREDVIKGNGSAVLAAGIVSKSRPVKLSLSIKGNTAPLNDLAKTCGIELEKNAFRPSGEFRKWLRTDVDVVLNPSLTDAFQYVAMDALTQGRPVVGSQTIRYLPSMWQADPNDPADIARVALMFLDDYPRYSAEALRLGCEIRDRQREAYHAAVARILE